MDEFNIAENLDAKCVLIYGPTLTGKSKIISKIVKSCYHTFEQIHGFAPTDLRRQELLQIDNIKIHDKPELDVIEAYSGYGTLMVFDNSFSREHGGDKYEPTALELFLSFTTNIHTFHSEYDCPAFLKRMNDTVIIFTHKQYAISFFNRKSNNFIPSQKQAAHAAINATFDNNTTKKLVYMCKENKFYYIDIV